MEKLCPLKIINNNYTLNSGCAKACAWYDSFNDRCSVLTIANKLDTVSEVADGTRTLFVKEL